uniref:Uncharacterized protein n=1 Tax=Clastoptera arizonana TaxID=38151 RepID=A0A1B6ECE6_9HEMI
MIKMLKNVLTIAVIFFSFSLINSNEEIEAAWTNLVAVTLNATKAEFKMPHMRPRDRYAVFETILKAAEGALEVTKAKWAYVECNDFQVVPKINQLLLDILSHRNSRGKVTIKLRQILGLLDRVSDMLFDMHYYMVLPFKLFETFPMNFTRDFEHIVFPCEHAGPI